MSINVGNSDFYIVHLGDHNSTAIYRALGLKEQLEIGGFKVRAIPLSQISLVPENSIVILQRIQVPLASQPTVLALKSKFKAIVYDVDDYLLSPEDMPTIFNKGEMVVQARAIRWGIENATLTLVSTLRLKEILSEETKANIEVRRNVLQQQHVQTAFSALKNRTAPTNPVIGYCSGSPTHDRDFLVALPGLSKIMKQYPVQFALIGSLQLPIEFSRSFASRIRTYHHTKYEALSALMRDRISIAMAPLQKNKFNSCKSNVKVLEAGILGIPIVCSDVGMYASTIRQGQDGMLANTDLDWEAALQMLFLSEKSRRVIGQEARKVVLDQYTTKNLTDIQAIFKKVTQVSVSKAPKVHIYKSSKKERLRVLSFRWHCGHQWELHHLPYDFVLSHAMTSMCWDYRSRPLRNNVVIVPEEKLDFKFDLALLHFDENVLSPERSKGVLNTNWGAQFVRYLKTLAMPKITICHGTVPRKGSWDLNYTGDPWEIDKEARDRVVDLLGNTLVVCNSHAAQKEWGFRNSRVIHHGFDANEYKSGKKKFNILAAADGFHLRPWYQGWPYLKAAIDAGLGIDVLGKPSGLPVNFVRVPEPDGYGTINNRYAEKKFESYKRFLSQYRVYFSPTWFSPMPRTRMEAMLSGCCVVTTGYHDEPDWIKNGETGFVSNDPQELISILKSLVENPTKAEKIGSNGRDWASKHFTRESFLGAWRKIVDEILA